jgi:hypothetical protein
MGLSRTRFIPLLYAALVFVSCGQNVIPTADNSSSQCSAFRSEYGYQVTSNFSFYPAAACGSSRICGTFTYQKRLQNYGNEALSNTCTPPFPVQFAEVDLVVNGAAQQKTYTDQDGNFSFSSVGTSTYTVSLISKTLATDTTHRVDVRDNLGSNQNYRVDFSSVRAGTRINYTVPILHANGTHLAGAFNILSVLSNAEDQVLTRFGSVTGKDLIVYWEAGNDAATSEFATPTSTDQPQSGVMYILGGVAGQLSSTDTDEFDDSVILHEFGHFLDYVFSSYDTPGGGHSYYATDPRLAWGEGQADFWSGYFRSLGASRTAPTYRDTVGFGTSSTYGTTPRDFETNTVSVAYNYTTTAGASGTATISLNGVNQAYSVREVLWDLYDSVVDSADTISVNMQVFWKAFRDMQTSPAFSYRGMDTVLSFLKELKLQPEIAGTADATTIDAIAAAESMNTSYFSSASSGAWPPALPVSDGTVAPLITWQNSTDATISTDALSICDGIVSLLTGAGTYDYCWLTGRRILGLPQVEYSSSVDPSSNYLSRRWFRISLPAARAHRIFLKSGCLPTLPSGESYQSITCSAATVAGPELNDYQSDVNNLNMRLWAAPTSTSPKRVGVDSDLYLGGSSSFGTPTTDDDDFDGDPQGAESTNNTGIAGDIIDNNSGSESFDTPVLDATKYYYLEVYGDSTLPSASQQMEGRFRVFACNNTDPTQCMGAPPGPLAPKESF